MLALGIKQVLEGRRIFAELTVDENPRIGGHVAPKSITVVQVEAILYGLLITVFLLS